MDNKSERLGPDPSCRLMPHPTGARGSEPQLQSRGSVSTADAGARLHVRPPCPRPGSEWTSALGRGAGDRPQLTRNPGGTGTARGRMRWAFRSAQPEWRELSDSTSGSATRLGLEITRLGRSDPSPASRRGLPAPRASPRPFLQRPSRRRRRLNPLPEDKPGGRYPA